MKCGCGKKAIFETEAEGKATKRVWCGRCFAEKVGKYAMKVRRL